MLAGLRLDALVGGDHQQHEADAAEPGERVVEESLVAGNVDEADLQAALEQMGEAEIDRDAAGLLFGPAIAIDPGQRLE